MGGFGCVLGGGTQELSVLSTQLYCEVKTVTKKLVIKKKKIDFRTGRLSEDLP